MQVLCKLLAKGFANKTIHDIMHAGAWRGEDFLYTRGELDLYLYNNLYKHKAKAPQRYKNVSLGSLAHA